MALNQFNLTDLFAATWGYAPANITVNDPDGGKNVRQTGDQSGDIQFQNKQYVNKKSEPGRYGSYYAKDVMGRDVFMPLTLGGLFLPYVWLNIKGSKITVETPMTERRGRVIEMIAFDNYQIDVKGFAIGHTGRFPEEQIERLKELFEREEALECKCVLTDIFLLSKENGGQDKVVMRDLEIMENQGIEHVRGFQFSLVSDQILELELA
jgi:hypothetical protein